MKIAKNSLFTNSTIAFGLAGITAITLHEIAHFVAGKAIGENGTLFSNAVEYSDQVSKNHQILTAASGPLFSLLTGFILIFVAQRWGKGFWRLFWMWLGLMSAQIGFGYFLIAPFAQNGDTGKVFELLSAPSFMYYISFAIGIFGTLWLSKQFSRQVVRYTNKTPQTMRPFGIFSWLSGTAILLFVYIFAVRNLSDADQLVCLAGVISVGIFAPMFSFFWKKQNPAQETLLLKAPVAGLVGLLLGALVIIFYLANGVSL